MSETKIRGEGRTERRDMDFGQVRKVFDPRWIQSFESGRVSIQFKEESKPRDEALKNFMDMRGYKLFSEEHDVWKNYKFEEK